MSLEGVRVKLGKRPGAPKTFANILVVIRVPDAAEASSHEAPSAEVPATSGGAAPAPETALEPAPAAEPTVEPGPAAEAASAEASEEPPKKRGIFGWKGRKSKDKDDAEAADAPASGAVEPELGPDGEPLEGPITVIPEITDPNLEELETYAVQEPYAFIRVVKDNANHETVYEVIEPTLDPREQNILEFVEDTLVDVIEIGLSAVTTEEAANLLQKHVDDIIYDYSVVLTPRQKEKLLYYILRDFLGYGRLDAIMRDDLIEDISCDGPKVSIFLYHRKYESIRSTVAFKDDDEADSFVIRLAQRSGKHISIAEPLLDATLPDGSRLNATLAREVTAGGSSFTIRKFRDDPFTPPDLVRFGTMSPDMLAYWWLAVENGASAIYAGGTASGKTTSLNAILLFIPPQMKIVSIEDTREINLPHPNWIAGVTRSGFGPRDDKGHQAGEIDMFTLLKAALRQRPEYILVGEVRGQEAYALFQAMATGHTAYGTMHADSVESVIHRLESEPISIPRSLLEALDIVSIQIQTRIGGKRVRRTKEIVEVVGLDPHTREILTNQVFTWLSADDTFEFSGVSYVLERVQLESNIDEQEMRAELARRKEVIDWMIKAKYHDLKTVGHIIQSYYKDREGTMARCKEETARLLAEEEARASGEPPAEGEEPSPAEGDAAEAAPDDAAPPGPTPLEIPAEGDGDEEWESAARRLEEAHKPAGDGEP